MTSRVRVGGIVVIALSAVLLYMLVPGVFIESPRANPTPPVPNPVVPVRLTIPLINVDALIERVGITVAGLMDIPAGPDDVAWYTGGPRPGEIGSAVIDGHSHWKDKIPAVFDNLYKLRTGDKVYVKDSNGSTVTFIVREIKIYDPKSNAAPVFQSNDGKAHLNLITCEGVWNPVSKSSSKRLVIFTDKE